MLLTHSLTEYRPYRENEKKCSHKQTRRPDIGIKTAGFSRGKIMAKFLYE